MNFWITVGGFASEVQLLNLATVETSPIRSVKIMDISVVLRVSVALLPIVLVET